MDEIEQGDLNSTNEEQLLQEAETVPEPKKEYTPEQKLARVERLRAKYMKELGIEGKQEPDKSKPAGLDTAAYAYLAAKGIENDEEIDFIHNRMTKWDMTLRDVLKDEDVQAKLNHMRIEREMKAATPSSSTRTGPGAVDNVDYWLAKYERTGELPTDFALRSAVINAKVDRESPNKPSWR